MEWPDMTRIIDGKRYSTRTATLIAHDRYWDGSNYERQGRNHFLYRTAKGAFFVVNRTQWQGEQDTLRPVTEHEARQMYERELTEHEIEYEAAFPDFQVEDA